MTRPRTSFDSYTDPSSSHSSTLHPPTHTHRSLSPLHLPSTSRTKHTRRQDASRLLDPSYSNSSAPTTAVYIDHHGDAHDPDYRYFPAVQSQKRKAFWEDAVNDEAEEDEGEVSFFDRRYGAGAVRRSSWGSASPTQRGDRGRRRHSGSFGASSSPTSSGRSMSLFSGNGRHYESPPTSYEDDEGSVFGGEEFLEGHHVKERKSLLAAPKHLKKRRQKAASVSSTSPFDEDVPASPISISTSLPHATASHTLRTRYPLEEPTAPTAPVAQQEWTPTCGQSLRRQWQAIALRFRFGVFRAQRRVKRRVHSLL